MKLELIKVVYTLGILSISQPIFAETTEHLKEMVGEPGRGEIIFHVSGCGSCHSDPDQDDDVKGRPVLSGGYRFETEFGVFIAPNITPHPVAGIGSWSIDNFYVALHDGVSPSDEHYYPVFPYTSYRRMLATDIVDLKAFLDTLPISDKLNQPHELSFPYSIRAGLKVWKLLYLNKRPNVIFEDNNQQLFRGQYLVEGPGHCGECHTPRTRLGGPDYSRWLAGGDNPDGEGSIPNITPHKDGIGAWEEIDIASYLENGFTPEYDAVGGSMAEVVENTAKLTEEDRLAIAVYLKFVSAVASE